MDNSFEIGVSCYRLRRVAGEWRIDGAYGSYRMLRSSGRTLYEIAGSEIASGADGEPVLADARIVRRIRDRNWSNCWDRVECAALGCTEAIRRHCISGEIWVAMCGATSGIEFRCAPQELAELLHLYAPQRAAKILDEIVIG